MKYFEADFVISPCSPDAADLLAAIAGEAGFESFEETPTGLKGYVQQQLFDQEALQTALAEFPFDNVNITYTIREAEDRDWNEQWEQEGFEPIVVRDGKLVIHDGRHLPNNTAEVQIEIDAHLAFGTGTHETTRMICGMLLDMQLNGLRVLDCGCGTGILGICALKLGAASCVGYDIDEWSADNTRHNAVINRVDDHLTTLCGDASVLSGFDAEFNLVMANINRNILLNDMEHFRSVMAPGAQLILSGFYKNDCALLESKAQTLGLSLKDTHTDGDWACLLFSLD